MVTVEASDLDELARLVAASEAQSPAPWRQDSDVRDATHFVVAHDMPGVDGAAIIALRNAASELIALAREALAMRAEVTKLRAQLTRMERLDACRCVDGHEPGCHKAAL